MKDSDVVDKEELRDRISSIVAGETISWRDYERYQEKAKPITISTLINAVRVESYLNATQDKVLSPGMKIALGTVFAIIVVLSIVWLIVQPTL